MKRKKALISVYNKDRIVEFSSKLNNLGYEIISTGGTYKLLKEHNIVVKEVSDITGFPEIFDGRVKTLHPFIHAGILARRENQEDMKVLNKLDISSIDIVVVNLYPFFEKQKENISESELIEFIDIGGPTMLRSAAKNFKDVLVIADPNDYDEVIERIEKDNLDYEYKKSLAFKVFSLTSAYDAAIARFLGRVEDSRFLSLSFEKSKTLRYGENPHQKGWLFKNTDGSGTFNNIEILNGKELSYNNIKDIDAAVKLVYSFDTNTIVAVKHNIPCAVASSLKDSQDKYDESYIIGLYDRLYKADPISVFGGIIAANFTIDKNLASRLSEIFLEVIISPEFSDEAIEILSKKKNLRLVKLNSKPSDKYEFSSVDGALLLQEIDLFLDNDNSENFVVVTEKKPTKEQVEDLIFAQIISKFVKSNAIVTAKDKVTCGICGGQTNRIWAAKEALSRSPKGAVLASDGFFPFPDVVEEAAKHGISAIIQPGGSVKDKDSIDMCNKYGIPMIFTNVRHFKH